MGADGARIPGGSGSRSRYLWLRPSKRRYRREREPLVRCRSARRKDAVSRGVL